MKDCSWVWGWGKGEKTPLRLTAFDTSPRGAGRGKRELLFRVADGLLGIFGQQHNTMHLDGFASADRIDSLVGLAFDIDL